MDVKKYLPNGVGIFCLCGFIWTLNVFAIPSNDVLVSTFFESILLIPVSLRLWEEFVNLEIRDWIGLFFAGIVITFLFLFMDCGYTNPINIASASCIKGMNNFGFVFTLLSVAVSLVSLAGAIKIWFAKYVL
ncbi:hypothetical protein H8L32_00670 [Undibacterium sp. CY18W]|uniref:Uncharacterized protein n=1 Tax=Undibacterium hunanense TaxID=2762292 RepID=A0ABR6ZKC2_9BURK|nr:hypothetical protein [Undibacterium hunanense]MBC3915983.1 hypothetical protein [Undibacterium hunanense]